jgi:hypothetical protein
MAIDHRARGGAISTLNQRQISPLRSNRGGGRATSTGKLASFPV